MQNLEKRTNSTKNPWKNGRGGHILLFRKIYSELEKFYSENPREALLVTGARQIGKSFVIREFGKSHFEHFVEIN